MTTTQPTEPVISVAEYSRRLRRVVEESPSGEWVEGEVSGSKTAPSGHVYFSLKDEREPALIDCVMYRTQALRFRKLLTDGTRIQVRGKASLWVPRGRLQFSVEQVRPAGTGSLLLALEELKQRLAAEGLFDPARKRALPADPRVIGVVTSAVGAAWHDVVAVAFRRGGAHLVLSAALVQGQEATKSLISAIDLIERHPRLDVLIIGRGGGSNDDLMAFNDERVVRRIAAVRVPVVSAVGHDVDTTLSDWVADVRAATPSQAAELVVMDATHRQERLARHSVALRRSLQQRLVEDRATLQALRARVADPRFTLLQRQQQLDESTAQLATLVRSKIRCADLSFAALQRRLHARHPLAVTARARGAWVPLAMRLSSTMRDQMSRRSSQLSQSTARLSGLSPLTVLSRGYAIAYRLDGRAVRSSLEIDLGEPLALRLHQGGAKVVVQEKHMPEPNIVDGTSRGPEPC
jgi:exodeoxyribonuclease VII large subunit